MVNHIVLWNFKEELNVQEKREAAERIRMELEAVKETYQGSYH